MKNSKERKVLERLLQALKKAQRKLKRGRDKKKIKVLRKHCESRIRLVVRSSSGSGDPNPHGSDTTSWPSRAQVLGDGYAFS